MLTADDLIDVEMKRRRGRVTGFAVHYRAFVAGAWHTIWRQDTAHGRLHCHEPGRPVRFLEQRRRADYSEAFTQAERHIRAHWPDHKRRWMLDAGPEGPGDR